MISKSKLFRLCREIDLSIKPVLLEKMNDWSGFLEEILTAGGIIYITSELQD